MKKLKILYFIIIIELFMLGIVVFIEKKDFEAKDNKYFESTVNQDKVNSESGYWNEKNYNNNENPISQDKKVSDKLDYQIVNRDELKERINKNLSNEDEKMSLEEIEKILKDEAISVFKVDCSTIKGSLNLEDKKNILSIAIKVDKEMFNTIKDLLYHENQEYGVLKAIILLKGYLNEKDFEKVSETASKYVDMSRVEEYYYLQTYGASLQ